jgi:hypothetical protein
MASWIGIKVHRDLFEVAIFSMTIFDRFIHTLAGCTKSSPIGGNVHKPTSSDDELSSIRRTIS